MSLCKICSKLIYREGDVLCSKHMDEYNKITELIQSGEIEPPFGFTKEAWNVNDFAEIGYKIRWANRPSLAITATKAEDVEKEIKKIVDDRNREVASRAKKCRGGSPENEKRLSTLASTLGITL